MNNRVSGGLAGPALKPAVEVVDVCMETKIFLGEAPSNANTAGQHLHKESIVYYAYMMQELLTYKFYICNALC